MERQRAVFVARDRVRRNYVFLTLARPNRVCPRSWGNFHVSRILETSK